MNFSMSARGIARSVIVAVAIVSLLALFNHCAAAALAISGNPKPAGCGCCSAPEKTPAQSTGVVCCKILRAICPVPAKKCTPVATNLPAFVPSHEGVTWTLDGVDASYPFLLDTGPLGTLSFAEAVLQRSILAHGPPFVA